MTQTTTSNERTLAGLAHASIILGFFTNGLGGAIAAVLIWATQKDKSAYVAFQALQAAIYQIAGMVIMTIAWCCWLLFYMATFLVMIPQLAQYSDAPPPIFWLGLASMIVPFAVMGLWTLYGLWGAVRAFSGADFRYLIVGTWVARYLDREQSAA